jgi:hypothetical protein
MNTQTTVEFKSSLTRFTFSSVVLADGHPTRASSPTSSRFSCATGRPDVPTNNHHRRPSTHRLLRTGSHVMQCCQIWQCWCAQLRDTQAGFCLFVKIVLSCHYEAGQLFVPNDIALEANLQLQLIQQLQVARNHLLWWKFQKNSVTLYEIFHACNNILTVLVFPLSFPTVSRTHYISVPLH